MEIVKSGKPELIKATASHGLSRIVNALEATAKAHSIHTAAAVSLARIAVCSAFHRHALGGCPDRYPLPERYCPVGAERRHAYKSIPWS